MELKKAKTQKTIFVIMPFISSPTRSQSQLTSYFENNIKTPIEEASLSHEYKVWRSGETFNITDEIIRDLFRSDLVIADLSGTHPNPNVMYELGVRLSLSDKPVILIREKHPDNKKVFDVDSYYIHQYDPLAYTELEKHLINKLKRFESGEELFESPVRKVLKKEITLSPTVLNDISILEQKNIMAQGGRLIEKNISIAFGPLGFGIPIKNENNENVLAKQGSEICATTWSSNPLENKSIDLLLQVSNNMLERVGDGTKVGVLLTNSVIQSANEALKQGHLAKNIISGISKAIEKVISFINSSSRLLNSKTEVAQVAGTASKNIEHGKLIADCLEKAGRDGIVVFEKAQTNNLTVEITNGIKLNYGYISKNFLIGTDAVWRRANSYVLIYPAPISDMTTIFGVLEKIAREKKPLLIIAEDINQTAYDTLSINVKNKVIDCMVIKIPNIRRMATETLEDICAITGAKIISSDKGLTLSNLQLSDLGIATNVEVSKNSCIVKDGRGTENDITGHVKMLREQLALTNKSHEKSLIQERLAMITGSTIIVRVGGVTPHDISEKMYNLKSALNSAYIAIESGVVVGGCITLYNAIEEVRKIEASNEGEKSGINAVANALGSPVKCLLNNSNLSLSDAMEMLAKRGNKNEGINVHTGKLENLETLGIFEPSFLLESALNITLSYSKMFLESSSWIDNKNREIENIDMQEDIL
ncbi:MAG: hypothetical protein JNL74_23900 [Fibrobacteres bacterium]|nr:hypothetical protein [Fibrobacterota bacterium]